MDIPLLKEYSPIADWPTFRVLRAVAISAIVLGLIFGGIGEYVGGATKNTTDAVFAVSAAVRSETSGTGFLGSTTSHRGEKEICAARRIPYLRGMYDSGFEQATIGPNG